MRDCLRCFLVDSWNEDEREYHDATDQNRHDPELIKGIERNMTDFLLGGRSAWLEAANYDTARTVMVLSKLSLLSWLVVIAAVAADLVLLAF